MILLMRAMEIKMNTYHITEVDPSGFAGYWDIKAKNLTSAKKTSKQSPGLYTHYSIDIFKRSRAL